MYRLIIVDDEPWVAADLMDSVSWERLGFEVDKVFSRSTEALAYLCESNPQAALVDIRMPVLDGLELIRKCRRSGCSTHFVILSAHKDFAYAREAIRLGVIDYSPKPVDPREIEEIFAGLRELLDEESAASDGGEDAISPDTFEAMLEYIRQHLEAKLSLQEISDAFFVNRNYVCNLFRKRLDTTFSQFVNEERLSRAKKLLAHADLTLAEIAARVGFKDEFYLSRVFKKYEGVSPGLYRKLRRGEREGDA